QRIPALGRLARPRWTGLGALRTRGRVERCRAAIIGRLPVVEPERGPGSRLPIYSHADRLRARQRLAAPADGRGAVPVQRGDGEAVGSEVWGGDGGSECDVLANWQLSKGETGC